MTITTKQKILVSLGAASFVTGIALIIAGEEVPGADYHPEDKLYIPGCILAIAAPLIALTIWGFHQCLQLNNEMIPLITPISESHLLPNHTIS